MKKTWHIWLLFFLFLGVVIGVMAWITHQVLNLERRRGHREGLNLVGIVQITWQVWIHNSALYDEGCPSLTS